MKCAIMQPTYIPWVGYFSMIDRVDTFVFLDDVQLVKRSWQVRNKIKNSNSELMLSIPIKKKSSGEKSLINDAICNDELDWKESHLKSIQYSYSKSTYYHEVISFLTKIYEKKHENLSEFNIELISCICNRIGINTSLKKSSSIPTKYGTKDLLLSTICVAIGSKYYLSAKGSAFYIEANGPGGEFTKQSVEVYYHMYNHPVYNQLGKNFISHLGILDLLFNEGFSNALHIIRSGNQDDMFYREYRKNVMKDDD